MEGGGGRNGGGNAAGRSQFRWQQAVQQLQVARAVSRRQCVSRATVLVRAQALRVRESVQGEAARASSL